MRFSGARRVTGAEVLGGDHVHRRLRACHGFWVRREFGRVTRLEQQEDDLMSDKPLTPPESATNPQEVAAVETAGPTTKPSTKPSRRPQLGPPIFGRFCWLIVFVPYVLYLAGTSGTQWLEGRRADSELDGQKLRVINGLTILQNELIPNTVLPDEFAAADGRFGIGNAIRYVQESEVPTSKELTDKVNIVLKNPEIVQNSSIDITRLQPLLKGIGDDMGFYAKMLDASKEGAYRQILEESHQRNLLAAGAEERSTLEEAAKHKWFPSDRTWYPVTYALTVAITTAWVLLISPGLFKAPFNFSYLSIVVGVAGIFVWIGLWALDAHYLGWFSKLDSRAAFNPFEELKENPAWMRQFLAIRFFGLVLLVPLVEEFFLRGFLMRYIDDPDWDQIPLGTAGRWAILGVFIYAGFSHPSELIAALPWFGMVTWLYLKTNSIWNCVIAHSITNLLLGLYVVYTGTWDLW